MLVLLALLLQTDAPGPIAADLVEIVPGPKRYFHDGDERNGCPALTAACRRRGYVVAGDRLIAWEARGPLTRVTYLAPGANRPAEGWIESAALRHVAVAAPRTADWLGGWSVWESAIDITPGARTGTLHFSGNATWGSHDPERVKRGGVNYGGFSADLTAPGGGRLELADSDDPGCRVAMRLLGPYLVARDNQRCGGVNVSFTGVYRR